MHRLVRCETCCGVACSVQLGQRCMSAACQAQVRLELAPEFLPCGLPELERGCVICGASLWGLVVCCETSKAHVSTHSLVQYCKLVNLLQTGVLQCMKFAAPTLAPAAGHPLLPAHVSDHPAVHRCRTSCAAAGKSLTVHEVALACARDEQLLAGSACPCRPAVISINCMSLAAPQDVFQRLLDGLEQAVCDGEGLSRRHTAECRLLYQGAFWVPSTLQAAEQSPAGLQSVQLYLCRGMRVPVQESAASQGIHLQPHVGEMRCAPPA